VRRGRVAFVFFVFVAVVATALLAAPARAYVRFQNNGFPLYWKQACVPVTIYTNGLENTPGLTLEKIAKSITAAAHAWSGDAVSCSSDGSTHPYLEIVPTLVSGEGDEQAVPNDARNTVVVDRKTWGNSDSYSTNGLAFTRDSSSPDGHIVDADIEINDADPSWTWANLDTGDVVGGKNGDEATQFYDLQNTMTHEFGHFIGLAHTCYAAGTPQPTDDKGDPVPQCGTTAVTGLDETSVMYDSVMFEETSKRTLSKEDMRAVCEMYPPTFAAEPCALDQPVTGCAVAAHADARPSWPATAAVALGIVSALAARRRRALTGSARARA
jgi:MYXO-CTERM domain-containing protein